jgi:hypothetical protein
MFTPKMAFHARCLMTLTVFFSIGMIFGCGSGVGTNSLSTVEGTWKIVKKAVTGSVSPTSIDDPDAGYNGIDTGGQVAEQWTISNQNGQLQMTITDIYGQSYGPISGQTTTQGTVFQIRYQDPRMTALGVQSDCTTTIVCNLSVQGLWGTEEIKSYTANGLGIIDYSVPSTESWTFRGTR